MALRSSNVSATVVVHWERMQRFAVSMGLHLSLDENRCTFEIREFNKTGKIVASGLDSLERVERILSMYHRVVAKYGDTRAKEAA